jgi:hypothetical protein
VADALSIQPVVVGAEAACSGQVAQASTVDPPSTAADSLDHRSTAHLGSASSTIGAPAMYLIDLPAGGRAKFKVIALDPADPDSEQVLESAEVTCNGGIPDSYPATVLHASSSHHYGDLSVTLIGSGLSATQSVAIATHDESWRYPLDIVSKSDEAVTATTAIAAPLPPFSAEATIAGAPPIAVQLPADNFEDPQSPESCISQFFGSQDSLNLQPKDFAIVYGADKWHLFYIRRHQNAAYTAAVNERNLGHAESADLQNWNVVARNVLQVQPGQWDNLHVWAPSIVLNPVDLKYYMFYTGVTQDTIKTPGPHFGQVLEVQRIGVATSLNLVSWAHENSWVYSQYQVSWAQHDTTLEAGWQFRDPFVMPEPGAPGKYLMYYVAIDASLGRFVVGMARSTGNLRQWTDVGRLLKTNSLYVKTGVDTPRVESPHAFAHHGKWWVMFTATHPVRDKVFLEVNSTSPINPDSSTWSKPDSLNAVTCGQHTYLSTVDYWHASEHDSLTSTQVRYEYLAAWSDLTQSIDVTQLVLPPSTCSTDSFAMNCPSVTGVHERHETAEGLIRLVLSGASPAQGEVQLRIESPERMPVNVAVFDVTGRLVKTLLDGEAPPGRTHLTWDGRRTDGTGMPSGIYLARLTSSQGRRVVRVSLVR